MTLPFVAVCNASAVCGSSSSATIIRFGLVLTAFTASTVETTVASPAESASRMMTDLAFEMLARLRSSGFVGSPVRVITFSLPNPSARDSISSSMNSRSWVEKITTVALRTFELATASSLRMGNTRFDHPRIRVWPLSMTGLLPLRRRVNARLIAPTMKPVTLPATVMVMAQLSNPTRRSAQLASVPRPVRPANEDQKVSKVHGASGAVSGNSKNGNA